MINKQYKYEYCLKCGKDHSDKQDEPICECGSRNWIFGDKLVRTENGFSCGCDKPTFRMFSHVNMSPVYNSTYQCDNCNAIVGKQIIGKSSYI